jgi:hypothetical protein
LSGRGLCDELVTRPEESYRLWCVIMCDIETSCMRRPWPTGGWCAKTKKQGKASCNLHTGCLKFWSSEGKDFPVHAMKAYRRRSKIVPLILSLIKRWKWVLINFMPRTG